MLPIPTILRFLEATSLVDKLPLRRLAAMVDDPRIGQTKNPPSSLLDSQTKVGVLAVAGIELLIEKSNLLDDFLPNHQDCPFPLQHIMM